MFSNGTRVIKSKSVGFEAEMLSSVLSCSALLEHTREGWAATSIFQEPLNNLQLLSILLLPLSRFSIAV